MVTQLDDLVTDSCTAFNELNKCYPQQMIFFRDGVGDSQIKSIINNEIEQIKSAFNRIPETKNLPFIFVMVNKRIKTKLVTQ